MANLKIEHVLILVIVAFVLYHFIGRCNCMRSIDGFSIGIPDCSDHTIEWVCDASHSCDWITPTCDGIVASVFGLCDDKCVDKSILGH